MKTKTSKAPGSFPRPRGASRLLFEGQEYRYEFIRTLVEHEDHEPLVIARRRPRQGEAPHLVLIRRVVMPPGEERRLRAAEEVQLATRLHHPNISRVFTLEEYEGEPYVIMEHMSGCFLATAMDVALLQERRLSPAFACYIAAEVADALHYAHHLEGEDGRPLRVVHRAVSPMSIRLGRSGEVKLGHFGAAYSEQPGRLRTPPLVLRADLTYAAPEVFLFEPLDGRADLFSLGVVLLEMLTGRYLLDLPDLPPVPGGPPGAAQYSAEVHAERRAWAPPGELAHHVLSLRPEEVERAAGDVPEPLKRVLHKALRREPAERYQTGGEMREELRSYLRDLGRPFGPPEAAEELASLLEPGSLREIAALPIERGVLRASGKAATKKRLH